MTNLEKLKKLITNLSDKKEFSTLEINEQFIENEVFKLKEKIVKLSKGGKRFQEFYCSEYCGERKYLSYIISINITSETDLRFKSSIEECITIEYIYTKLDLTGRADTISTLENEHIICTNDMKPLEKEKFEIFKIKNDMHRALLARLEKYKHEVDEVINYEFRSRKN